MILRSRLQCRTTNSGFTLIEVLIALFIGSLIFGVLYASFFQIMKSKEIAESELELYHEARVIFSRVTKDLSSVYPRGNVYMGNAEYTSKVPYFVAKLENDNNTWVRFTSLSRAPSYNKSDSDQAEITYYTQIVDDERSTDEKPLYSLIRRENPYIGGDEEGVAYSLSDRIVFFRLYFLTDDDVESEDSYSDLWNSNDNLKLPKAVEINLVLKSPREEDIEFRNLIYLQLSE